MELGLDSQHQEFTYGGYIRQFWNDPRLAIDLDADESSDSDGKQKGKVTMKFRDIYQHRKIWIPDTFIPGDKYGFFAEVPEGFGARSFVKVKNCGGVATSMK